MNFSESTHSKLKTAFQLAVALAYALPGQNPAHSLPGSSYLYDRLRGNLSSR